MAAFAPTGSPRWWRRLLANIGLRLAGLVFLIVAMATSRMSGVELWIGVAGGIAMVMTLLPPVLVCLVALRDPALLERNVERTPDS